MFAVFAAMSHSFSCCHCLCNGVLHLVISTGCSKKYAPNDFWQYFPKTDNFYIKFYTPIVCLCLCKNTRFSQQSLTQTKLCHIKRGHLVNFYISLEKREKL